MTVLPNIHTHFFASEEGAVTVDWVVLTAALVGLGLAVMSVVSGGLSAASDNIDGELRRQSVLDRFAFVSAAIANTFSDGPGDWIGGAVVELQGFGHVLQVRGDETVTLPVDIPSGADSATISFDLIGANDLDNDPATILVNGQEVAIYRDNHGNVTRTEFDIPGVSVNVNQLYTNDPAGAGNRGHDSRATYTITVDNPSDNLTLEVKSGANDGLDDEFHAIDDVSVTTG